MLLLTGVQQSISRSQAYIVSHPLSLYRRNYPLNKQKFSHAVLPRLSLWFATKSSQGPFFRHTTRNKDTQGNQIVGDVPVTTVMSAQGKHNYQQEQLQRQRL